MTCPGAGDIPATSDITNSILAAEGRSVLDHRKTSIVALGELDLIDDDLESPLREAVGFRDDLAHSYGPVVNERSAMMRSKMSSIDTGSSWMRYISTFCAPGNMTTPTYNYIRWSRIVSFSVTGRNGTRLSRVAFASFSKYHVIVRLISSHRDWKSVGFEAGDRSAGHLISVCSAGQSASEPSSDILAGSATTNRSMPRTIPAAIVATAAGH